MTMRATRLAGFIFLGCAIRLSADTHFVDLNCASPAPPYTNWATAATNIQDAVNAATSGEVVLVTNGVYATGGVAPALYRVSSRTAVTNAITVQSVNGPLFTSIEGYRVPGTVAATNAIRCATLTGGAFLSGFTLTNGEAGIGNDVNGGAIAGSYNSPATVSNCVFTGNVCSGAGGAAMQVNLQNCVLAGNQSGAGAAADCALVNCVVTNNFSGWAAGLYSCSATNCLVANNWATNYGGGSGYSTLVNCTVTGNTLQPGRGGTGGGSFHDTVLNSIVYNNSAPGGSNYSGSSFAYSCTAPVAGGSGNTAAPPLLVNPGAGDYHLLSTSPCIGAGYNAYVLTARDLDGNARLVAGTVDLGAYEFQGNVRYVSLAGTNPLAPYSDWSIAATNIQDAIDAATPGDLVLVSNGVYLTGGRAVRGISTNRIALTKPITVQSVNGSAVTSIEGSQDSFYTGVRCAYLTNGATLSGFTLARGATRNTGTSTFDWNGGGAWCESTSATLSNCVIASNTAYVNAGAVWYGTIKDSVVSSNIASGSGGAVFGSVLINCALSLNTVGRGYGGAACSASLSNCTLFSNIAGYGGGAANSTVCKCDIATNIALYTGGGVHNSTATLSTFRYNSALSGYGGGQGGGVSAGLVTNCLLIHNTALRGGGGYGGEWYNCTIAANIATNSGGGVDGGGGAWLYNCIAYYNSAPTGTNLYLAKSYYSCTTPPIFETRSFTNAPNFVNLVGDDFHLQSSSPCINAGTNSYARIGVDLDGNLRIVGAIVDMGAYEFRTVGTTLPDVYAQQYGIPTDGSLDSDHDGLSNWQEWLAGTNPTNAASALRMLATSNTISGATLSWQSVPGVTYYVQRSTNFVQQPGFSVLQRNIIGQTGSTSLTDTTASGPGPWFYRVGVQQ